MIFLVFLIAQGIEIYLIPDHGTPPSPRIFCSMSYTENYNSLLVFGGSKNGIKLSDLWKFNLTTEIWIQINELSESAPSKTYLGERTGSAMMISKKNKNLLYLFGGSGIHGPLSDLWIFNIISNNWKYIADYDDFLPIYNFVYTDFIYNSSEYLCVLEFTNLLGYVFNIHLLDTQSLEWTLRAVNGSSSNFLNYVFLGFYHDSLYAIGIVPVSPFTVHAYRYSMENSALQNLSIPYDWRITSVSIIGSYLYVSLLGQDLFRTNLNAWGWERINNTMKSMQSIYIYAYPNPCSAVAGNTYYSLGTTVVASNAFASYTVASDLNITVSYVQNYNYPIPRLFHSINQINDQLYLFGGMSQQSYFNDLWIFNPSNFNWTNYVTTGVVPSGRAYHASGSSGHALLIYGGEDVTGLKSDLFIFNSLQNSWTEIIPTTQVVPGSRKGACMVFSMPDVFIFGGETPNGFSGELWKYDMSLNKYSLISSLKEGISYSSCQVINNSFYSFCGIDINFDQVGAFFFDFNLKLWYLLNYNISCTNQGVAIAVGDYFINYGGEYNVNSLSRTFSIKSFHDWSFRSLLNFDSGVYFFGAGFSYIQSSLYYNYGGAINFYGDIDTTRPSSFFFTLDVSDFMIANNYTRFCSPGTYYYNFNCVFCLPGTYAEGFGNLNCSICIPGTYGPSVGATSIRQCYPCPQGKYNNIYGASSCIDCPHGSTCPAGSTTQSTSSIPIETVSIQPSNYLPKNYNQAILRFEIFYVLFAVVLLIVIERLFKVKHKIKFFDIFGIEHYYNEGEVIVLRKNFLGGMCTMITLFTIGFFIISQIFIYLNENTRELKALQPLPVLQNEVDKFIGDIEVSISLYYYGDSCVKNNQCSAEIYLEGFILAKVSDSYICRKTSISCVITYYCNSCEIGPNSYVQLNLKEKFSYSSIINVNVSSSSSVLDSISSVSIGISANDIFIGASPSEFYFLMIPSLFTSTVAGFPDKLTGYHVSFDRLVPGSEYKSEDLATVAGLSINVYLDNGLNGLLTTRYPNQTLLAILSGILGSIGGILSAAGLLMKLTEKFINDIQNYNQKSIKVRSMKENRKKLKQEALRLETREDDI